MATTKKTTKVAKKATAKKTAVKKFAVTDQKVGLGKVENFDNSSKKTAAKKTPLKVTGDKKFTAPAADAPKPAKKAAKKGVVVVKEVRASKPVKPGVPAKPKKSAKSTEATTAVATAAYVSLTVAELEAKINAVEGTGLTPRLVVIRRNTNAIINNSYLQASIYLRTTAPAPALSLAALKARLQVIFPLGEVEWFIRDLF